MKHNVTLSSSWVKTGPGLPSDQIKNRESVTKQAVKTVKGKIIRRPVVFTKGVPTVLDDSLPEEKHLLTVIAKLNADHKKIGKAEPYAVTPIAESERFKK